ncbi:MAG: radical SAM protein [Parcubacteria group bacterium]|nr:radical SAM protein [Parcubacteria group bacterium]
MSDKKLFVTLVRGPIVFKIGALNNEATPSIAYAYIASYLKKKGYQVAIVDAIGEGLNRTYPLKDHPGFDCQGLMFDEIIAMIPKASNVIGFSCMFSGEWPVVKELITQVRRHFPEVLFVGGGEHITALTEYSLYDCPALDVCVQGEGEYSFHELLETYSETGSFVNVSGIAYIDKVGQYRQNENHISGLHDIDDIPWPYWQEGYLEKFWALGKSYGIASERDIPLMFSRGCPYRCTFCSNLRMWNGLYTLRNVNDVIKEIKYYVERYHVTNIQLYDLTAITKKSWIVEFCRLMIDNGLKVKWSLPSGTRSEALDEEVLRLLKNAGCSYVVYAPESASPRTLKNIKKRIDLDQLTRSVIKAKQLELTTRINLIIGFPSETWSDVFLTIFYGLKMAFRGVDEVPLFIFSPYPGTQIFNELLEAGKVKLNDDYFFKLTSLGSYISADMVSNNSNINDRTLLAVRSVFMLLNYTVSYLFHPHRIQRTIRNLFWKTEAATVFEHRLKDKLKRNRILRY